MNDNDPVCEHNEKERVCFFCYTKRRDRIVAVLRDGARAWRAAFDEQTGKQIGDASDCREVALAREATDAANALGGK